MALQLRRGTDAERKLATFSVGEIIYTTDTKKVFVGDGTTVGGKFVGSFADAGLRAVTTFDNGQFVTNYETEYTADGHLAMNDKDVVGVRDLNVSRSVTSSLLPASTSNNLGSTIAPWGTLYVNNITANTTINANVSGTLTGNTFGDHIGDVRNGDLYGNVYSESNRKLIDWETEIFDGIFQGNLTGSVYNSDTSMMLDTTTQVLKLAPRTSEPAGATVGMIAIADGNTTGWDPLGTNLGVAYPAFYNGTAWKAFTLSA